MLIALRFSFLHGRSMQYEFFDKVFGDTIEALQYFDSSVVHVSLVVLDTPFLAETFDQGVGLSQVVSWNTRE